MMGPRQVEQGALFNEFSLDTHVPADNLLRSIDRFVDLAGLRQELAPFNASTGRPSVDPELMIRMLIIGYCLGIRSGRRLCDEARDIARSEEGKTSRRERKKAEMLFAHLKRILKLDRLRLRGPNGARDEFRARAATLVEQRPVV